MIVTHNTNNSPQYQHNIRCFIITEYVTELYNLSHDNNEIMT